MKCPHMTCHQCEDSEASALRKERDEARVEVERLRRQLAAVGATTAPLYTSQEREVLIQQRDEARSMLLDADSHIEELKYLNRKARDEAAKLREALSEISRWRKDCHEYDADMGHPLRDMDEGEIEAIEKYAGRILQEGETNNDSA